MPHVLPSKASRECHNAIYTVREHQYIALCIILGSHSELHSTNERSIGH